MHDFIEEMYAHVYKQFEDERVQRKKLQRVLDEFPDVSRKDAWEALPMLFWRGRLDSEHLRSLAYQDFLKTPYWLCVAEHVKKMRPWCSLCADPFATALEVHHRTYRNRGNEWQHLEDLTVLCRKCHSFYSRKSKTFQDNGRIV